MSNSFLSAVILVTTSIAINGQDVWVAGLYASPEVPNTDSLQIHFAVMNDGIHDLANLPWKMQIDGQDFQPGSLTTSGTITNLPGGGNVNLSVHPPVAAGTHTYAVVIDAANTYPTVGKINNGATLTVNPSSATGSDIDVAPVGYHYHPSAQDTPPGNPVAAGFEIHFWIYNHSPSHQIAHGVQWSLLVDGVPFTGGYSHDTVDVPGDGTTVIYAQPKNCPTGTRNWTIQVTSPTPETDTGNNSGTMVITVN